MRDIELLILSEIAKDSSCSLESLADNLGLKKSTTKRKGRRLVEEGYLISEKKRRVRYLTLKGSLQLEEKFESTYSDIDS